MTVTNNNSEYNIDAPKQASPTGSMTRAQFCEAEGFSISTFHKLKRAGHAPEEMTLPGTSILRITAKARRDWHLRMEKWRHSKAAKLEAQRRIAMATAAGEKSVASRKAAKAAAKKTATRRR